MGFRVIIGELKGGTVSTDINPEVLLQTSHLLHTEEGGGACSST